MLPFYVAKVSKVDFVGIVKSNRASDHCVLHLTGDPKSATTETSSYRNDALCDGRWHLRQMGEVRRKRSIDLLLRGTGAGQQRKR